jgi:hypothetical protein
MNVSDELILTLVSTTPITGVFFFFFFLEGPAEGVGNDVVHALDVRDGQVVLEDVMQPMRERGRSGGGLRPKGSGKALVVSVKVDGVGSR